MSGNMQRWISNDCFPGKDTSSNYSASHSDLSAEDQIRFPDIGQRLHSLYKEQLFTDVKFSISCGIKPKPTLLAHKAILAIGSDKFKEILYENKVSDLPDEFQINNIPYEAFKNVVEYLYTDDVYFENDQAVMETLTAAQTFQVQPLVEKCESFIESAEITSENACTKLQLANSHKLESLKKRCSEFIQENTRAVLRSTNLQTATLSIARSICKLEKLNLRSEIELFDGILQWVEAQPDAKLNRRALIEPFLKHIRFLTLSPEEFHQFVQKHPNIFTAPETANILIHLGNPTRPVRNLPSWCNKGPNRCSYHLLAPPQRGQRIHNFIPDKRMAIQLRPSRSRDRLPSLMCILELKCKTGSHQLKGLQLSFDDPVSEHSSIGHLIISVISNPSKFTFEELIEIQNSKDVQVNFSKRLFVNRGDTVYIKAEAKDVRNYNFLQFDDNSTFVSDSPFACSLGSVPKQNRLFFISEVIYTNSPTRRGPPPSRSRYRRQTDR